MDQKRADFAHYLSKINSISDGNHEAALSASPNSPASLTDVDHRDLFEAAHSLKMLDGFPPVERAAMSAELIRTMTRFWQSRKDTFLGFQAAQRLDYKERLGDLLNMQLNNIGDPFYDTGGFRLNCKVAERAILSYYSELWCGQSREGESIQPRDCRAASPQNVVEDKVNTTSGYVTCMGSTEANIYICRQARDYLKGKFLSHKVYGGDLDGGSKLQTVTHYAKRREQGDVSGIVVTTKAMDPSSPVAIQPDVSRHDPFEKLCEEAAAADASSSIAPSTAVISPHSPDVDHQVIRLLPQNVELEALSFREPIILYSTATHYSIGKIKDMLEIHTPDTFLLSTVIGGDIPKPSECFALSRDPNDAIDCAKCFPSDTWPNMLPTYEDGTINLMALRLLVKFFFSLGNPVIVLCNYGSTFTGVYDNPQMVARVIRSQPGCVEETQRQFTNPVTEEIEHRLTRRNYFIACDGALGAAFGSYWESYNKERTNQEFHDYLRKYGDTQPLRQYVESMVGLSESGALPSDASADEVYQQVMNAADICVEDIILPTYNLRRSNGVMAISMSSHKFLGAPTPGGLVLTIQKYMLDFLGSDVSYIGSPDTSISGSRSGLNVMFIYDYLSRHSHEMQVIKYFGAYNVARAAAKQIARSLNTSMLSVARDKPEEFLFGLEPVLIAKDRERQCGKPPLVFNFPGSLSVIFPCPAAEVVDRFSLSCDSVRLYKRDGYSFPAGFVKECPILTYSGCSDDDPSGFYVMRCAHIFAMNHVTVDLIHLLCTDLSNDDGLKKLVAQVQK